ncbi:MAG TPA: hypothetical protein VHM48_01125 [Candidatus Limnocylindrales bacterium]|nr:hypothetical protein [Candidatus Limnocylindrales bacterium]
MDMNVALPFASSTLSFVFGAFLLDQWRTRRRPYQLIWAIGMLWYALSAGTEFLGGAVGWSEPLYRAWYLIGAVWVAGWLGLGTVYLLGRTRFGYAFAVALGLAGLFTFLTWRKYDYPSSGIAPFVYLGVAIGLAVVVAVMTRRHDERWVHVAGAVVVGGSVVSALMALTASLPAPGWIVDRATHIPTGDLFPGYLRLLTPFFNITGAFVLVFGALYSAYMFMPKQRLVRYERDQKGAAGFIVGLLVAAAAISINFVASLPRAVASLLTGRLNSRVPATILIAIGGLIPAITSGANRFGDTSGFFVGELLGVLFLFLGFLVSIEVFHDFRVPFTRRVIRDRAEA